MTDPTSSENEPNPNTTNTNTNTSPTEDQQKKEALAAFTATLHSVGTNLEAPLIDRATTITSNAAALQRQETELAEHTARLAKQNAQWMGLADETRDGLKEIGDVQNWAEVIERDLLVLEDMMDNVERREGDGHGDGDDGFGDENRNRNGNGVVNGDVNGNIVNGKKEGRKSWFGWW